MDFHLTTTAAPVPTIRLRTMGVYGNVVRSVVAFTAEPPSFLVCQYDNPSTQILVQQYSRGDLGVCIPNSCVFWQLRYRVAIECFVWKLRQHCIHSAETITSMSMEHSIA